jgi:hypothetical protein
VTDVPRRIVAGLAVTLVVAVAAPTGVYARPPLEAAISSPTQGERSHPASLGHVRVVRVTTGDGFSWRDAAIGGAAVLAITMIAVGGALIVSNHNRAFPGTRG